MKYIGLLLICSTGLLAQSYKRPWYWHVSIATLTAANVADIMTSRGGRELNPVLRDANGRISMSRVIAIKSTVILGTVLMEHKTMTRKRRVWYMVLNVGLTAATATIAWRNARIPHTSMHR